MNGIQFTVMVLEGMHITHSPLWKAGLKSLLEQKKSNNVITGVKNLCVPMKVNKI